MRIECDTTEYDTPYANEEIDHCLTMREIRIEDNAFTICQRLADGRHRDCDAFTRFSKQVFAAPPVKKYIVCPEDVSSAPSAIVLLTQYLVVNTLLSS